MPVNRSLERRREGVPGRAGRADPEHLQRHQQLVLSLRMRNLQLLHHFLLPRLLLLRTSQQRLLGGGTEPPRAREPRQPRDRLRQRCRPHPRWRLLLSPWGVVLLSFHLPWGVVLLRPPTPRSTVDAPLLVSPPRAQTALPSPPRGSRCAIDIHVDRWGLSVKVTTKDKGTLELDAWLLVWSHDIGDAMSPAWWWWCRCCFLGRSLMTVYLRTDSRVAGHLGVRLPATPGSPRRRRTLHRRKIRAPRDSTPFGRLRKMAQNAPKNTHFASRLSLSCVDD